MEEVREVLRCRGSGAGRVTRIMLDNMVAVRRGGGGEGGAEVDVSMLREAVGVVDGQLETEVGKWRGRERG